MKETIISHNFELNDSMVESKLSSHRENKSIINTALGRYKILELDLETFYVKWEEYVLQHSESNIYNHPLWFKALENEYCNKGSILVYIGNNDDIKGVLPLLSTIGLPLKLNDLVTTRRSSSLPRTPLGGLLTTDREAKKMLLNAAIEKVNQKSKTLLQLKSYSSNMCEDVEEIKQIPWRSSYVLELPDDPTKIRFGNKESHHKVKWGVNKAKSLGIEVREASSNDDLRKWYKLYLETMRYHVVAVRPYRFFEFLWNNFQKKCLMTLLLAENSVDDKKQLISGSMFLHFNKTFFYSFNGRCQSGLASHANDLIQWEAIHLATKLGYKNYDMGEVSCNNSGLAQFKTKWGCCARPIYHYYYPLNEKMKSNNIDVSNDIKLKQLIWRNVPLIITEQWGILTNRFL